MEDTITALGDLIRTNKSSLEVALIDADLIAFMLSDSGTGRTVPKNRSADDLGGDQLKNWEVIPNPVQRLIDLQRLRDFN